MIYWRITAVDIDYLLTNDIQEEPEWIWGHEKRVYDSPPGQAYLRWMKSVGHTYRIRAALGVSVSPPLEFVAESSICFTGPGRCEYIVGDSSLSALL